MKFRSTYTFRRLVPIAAVSIGGFAIAGAFSNNQQPARIQITHAATASGDEKPEAKATPNISVNGTPIPLDENGQAHITTPSGASVNIDGSAPTVSATITSGNAVSSSDNSVNSSVNSVTSGTGHSSSSSSIQIFGNSSSSSSSYSRTTVRTDGNSNIQVNTSN